MKRFTMSLAGLVLLTVLATTAQAVTIDTVPVGNPGNAGEGSGESYGGYGPDAIVGAVDYAYNIGKYEVTAGQYAEFLNAVADTDAYGLYNSSMDSHYGCQITRHGTSGSYYYDFSGRPSGEESDWTNRPVNFVNWGNAARFANWLHNGQPTGTLTGDPAIDAGLTEDGSYDLNGATSDAALMTIMRESDATWVIPSEDEWYEAAYHKNDGATGNYFDYPTSSDNLPSNDLVEPTDPGNNATIYDSGYTIGSPYYRTEVGAHELSDSPYGTFDQAGNVYEWNEAVMSGSLRGWPGPHLRGARGGDWLSDDSTILLATDRGNAPPTTEYEHIGFRVAQVPEPSTITLLLCGLAGLLCWRRRK